MRIILVTFVLIGGATFFGFWSIGQFDQAFDDFSQANAQFAYSSLLRKDVLGKKLASTTPVISGVVATSTDLNLVSTSSEMTLGVATLTNPQLSFSFLQSDTKVYTECTYSISWDPFIKVDSLEIDLVDATTGILVEANTSGFAKENILEEDSDHLDWKVGGVLPGEYFILISKINGIEREVRSKYFMIYNMPEDISTNERKNICK